MARLPLVDVQSATGPVKSNFDALQRALGVVPNMTRAMANAPVVLNAYLQFSGALAGGKLPAPLREQIAILTADANDCTYCLSAHTALGGLAGLKPDQLDAARHARAADPRTQAALTFARAVIQSQGGVSDNDLKAVRAAGWSDGDVAEIIAAVALNLFTNYFNRAVDTDIDFPRVEARKLAHAR